MQHRQRTTTDHSVALTVPSSVPRWGLMLALVIAGAGCVRAGFSVPAPPADDMSGDRGPLGRDAANKDAPALQRCTWTGGFSLSPPEPLSEINSADVEQEPFLTADGLTLYFASNREVGRNAQFVATRPSRAAPFSTPRRLFEGDGGESHLSMTGDELTVFVAARLWSETDDSEIWIATRASATTPLQRDDFVLLEAVNTEANDEFDPFPSADGLRLYFSRRRRPSAIDHHIYVAERPSSGEPFAEPVLLDGIGTLPGKQDNPALTADERLIVFGRKIPEPPTDQMDIWYARRDGPGEAFGEPRLAPVVNSPTANDFQLYLSPDGCELLFASNRPGGKGGLDLYRSSYVPPAP